MSRFEDMDTACGRGDAARLGRFVSSISLLVYDVAILTQEVSGSFGV